MEPDDLSAWSAPGSQHPAALQALRERAEVRRRLVTQAGDGQTTGDLQRLVQELQVHQIELEMQYEELLLAQAEAERGRAQYVDLFEFAPVSYITLDGAGLMQQLNLRASQLLGTTRQRLEGRRFALFVAPADRAAFYAFLTQALAAEHARSCELRLLREDGTSFFAQIEALRTDSPSGQPGPHCRLALLDSTARRAATDALAASEARFRKLFTTSTDAVVLVQGGHFVDCNAAALRLLGTERREALLGRPMDALAPLRQPDGQLTASLFRASIATAQRLGSHRCEAWMHRVDGTPVLLEAALTAIEEDGSGPLLHILWRDVTGDRAAATALRESEARLSLALTASQTGVFNWSIATNQLEWDAQAQAVFGQTFVPAPATIEQLAERFHPDDAPRVWEATNAALVSPEPLVMEYRVVWPDGSVHHVSSAGSAQFDGQGRPTGFIGVLRDVTPLYAAQEELNYKSLVLERLLHNMPMVLSRFRPDGTYLKMTGAGMTILRLTEGLILGRNAFEAFPSVSEPMQQVVSSGQSRFGFEAEIDGEQVAFQCYGFFDEQRQQAVVLSFDVSETERQKRHLQAERDFNENLLESSIDGIVAVDREGRIQAWNSQATRYFGPSAAEAHGRPLFGLLPQLDHPDSHEVVRRVLSGEQMVCENQTFGHREGQFDAYHIPLREGNSGGVVTGMLILFRDVTERNRLTAEAAQLRQRQHQEVLAATLSTQESERRRIAESLHNGLGQLLYAAKLSLSSGTMSPAVALRTIRLLDEAIRATRTISFELTPGVLNDFGLAAALQELVKRIPRRPLQVRLHLQGLGPERLPAQVEMAAYRIAQELLNNIMKHAKATEAALHATLEPGEPALLRLEASDNGEGFDPEARTSGGIGLRGIRHRVELLSGTLHLDSQPGHGTQVVVELRVME